MLLGELRVEGGKPVKTLAQRIRAGIHAKNVPRLCERVLETGSEIVQSPASVITGSGRKTGPASRW